MNDRGNFNCRLELGLAAQGISGEQGARSVRRVLTQVTLIPGKPSRFSTRPGEVELFWRASSLRPSGCGATLSAFSILLRNASGRRRSVLRSSSEFNSCSRLSCLRRLWSVTGADASEFLLFVAGVGAQSFDLLSKGFFPRLGDRERFLQFHASPSGIDCDLLVKRVDVVSFISSWRERNDVERGFHFQLCLELVGRDSPATIGFRQGIWS